MGEERRGGAMVTRAFLFTDLEGSTAAWEAQPDVMAEAMRMHDDIVAGSLGEHRGSMVKHMGDGVIAAFGSTVDAVACGVGLQRALHEMPVRTRMGVHVGDVEARDGDFFGPHMNRSARVMGIAHGGQILVSGAARAALGNAGEPFALRSLGDHRLKGLYQAEPIFQVVADGLATEFPPVNSLNATIGNLPPPPDLIGREELLDQLEQAMLDEPVVAMIGPGGVGKTSLAVAAASQAEHTIPDGTWLVDLTATRPEDLARVVVEVVGLGAGPEATDEEALRVGLASRRLRLVLDNCEAVADAVAHLVDSICAAAPSTRILITSRIRVPSARVRPVHVDPLAAEDAESPAVELFLRRAQESRPGGFDDTDGTAIVGICQALDGLPLAIELAASRVKVLSPADILQRLDRRFALLKSGADRSQTLLATLEWSFDLLQPADQELFVRLGAFRSPFDLAAALAVAGDDADEFDLLESLANLADNSLIITAEHDGETVYRRLESVREFAALRLAEMDFEVETRQRHCAEIERLAERTAAGMLTDGCRVAADRAIRRMPDIRSAVLYATEHDPECARRLVELFWMAVSLNNQARDAAEWLDTLVARMDGVAGLEEPLARALGRGSDFHFQSGDHGRSAEWAERSISVAEEHGFDPPGLALIRRATAAVFRGDLDDALVDCDQALAQADAKETVPHYLGAIGVLIAMCGDSKRGQDVVWRALDAARANGPFRVVTALLNLNLATPPESIDARIERAAEGREAAQLLESRPHESAAVRALAFAKVDRGDDDAPEVVFSALALARETGHRSGIVEFAEHLAVLLREVTPSAAATLLSAAARHRAELGIPATPEERDHRETIVNELRAGLGPDRSAEAAAATDVTLDDLVALSAAALEQWSLARALA